MKRIFCLTLFLIPSLLTALLFANCATVPIEQRIDYKPMYGQPDIPRPEYMKKTDEDFIKTASGGFGGNRKDASLAWMAEAERFMQKGDLYNAMRRYNQSWLLNPDSFLPYWGFGRVMLERHEFNESIKYFEKATQLIDDEFQKPALLSDVGAAYSFKAQSIPVINQAERKKYFEIANQNFEKSSKLDKSYSEVWRRWAYSLYEEGNYSEAWEKVKKARAVGATPMPEKFISALSGKSPEPK